jgi:hypothetical protein
MMQAATSRRVGGTFVWRQKTQTSHAAAAYIGTASQRCRTTIQRPGFGRRPSSPGDRLTMRYGRARPRPSIRKTIMASGAAMTRAAPAQRP